MHDTKFNELVHLYLDDCIEQDDLLKLQSLLQESQSHREVFRDIALLHEQLSQTLPLLALPAESIRLARQVEQITLAQQVEQTTLARQAEPKSADPAPSVRKRSNRSTLALIGVVAATFLLVTLLLPSRNRSFAGSELQRILHANQNVILHYRIDVDQTSRMKKSRSKTNTDARPPKPSLHQAELFVEGSDRFVLIRTPEVGQAFITGCDGAISWAIAPQGAVRVSKDLGQFNRDIPGHEHSIPLANLKLGFEKIQKAYDVQFLAPAPDDSTSDSSDDTYKSESSGGEALLIATKHRGERGPKRIEIHYDSITGEIQQMRFVDMPYGPDQITIRLSLLDHTPVPEDFFHHTYHHSSDRTVIDESP